MHLLLLRLSRQVSGSLSYCSDGLMRRHRKGKAPREETERQLLLIPPSPAGVQLREFSSAGR